MSEPGSFEAEDVMGSGFRARVPPWWRALTSLSRLSLIGLGAAGLLAVGLGIYIPRVVERHMLASQTASHARTLEALVNAHTVPEGPEADYTDLDRFVRTEIVRGEFVRVKLWSPSGRILYSDDARIVGQQFPVQGELAEALRGKAQSEISDLTDLENRFERGLSPRLLEFYIPVGGEGRTIAVWEVYQSLEAFEASLRRVRLAVWASVGSGLGILLVFLVSSFGTLIAAIERRRREAEQRTRELGTLLDVSRSVGASLDAEELAEEAVEVLRQAGGFRTVGLVRSGAAGTGFHSILAASRDDSCPERCLLAARPGVMEHARGCVSFGVELGGPGGDLTLVACRPAPYEFSRDEHELLRAAGKQIRMSLENARLYESQRTLMSRLVSAHEDERKHIVGEIHDGLGQDLHRMLFGLRGCRGASPTEVTVELERLEGIAEESIRRLRRLLQELRPSSLEDVGLAASLRTLAEQIREQDGLDVRLSGADDAAGDLPVPVRVAVFRIVQEALRNVRRHAGVNEASVELARDDGELTVRIADEGHGLSGEPGDGLGLWLMRERAEALGGTVVMESGATGTSVLARIPVGVRS